MRMPMKKSSTLFFLIGESHPSSGVNLDCRCEAPESYLNEMKPEGFLPSPGTIQNILDFASAYDVLETETVGQTEMILN